MWNTKKEAMFIYEKRRDIQSNGVLDLSSREDSPADKRSVLFPQHGWWASLAQLNSERFR